MFSQLHYDYLAFLCWALLLATAAGSVISLAVLILHRVFKQKVVRYSLFLVCQLNFIPFLVLTLVFAKPFTALKVEFLEAKDSVSAVDSSPLNQEMPIEIAQSSPANSPASAAVLKEDIKQESPVQEVHSVQEAPEKQPLLIREKLRDLTQKFAPVLATFWFIGILVLTLRLIIAAIGLSRLKKYGVAVSPELSSFFEAVKKGVYEKKVVLLESAKVATPMVVSWVRPAILLPVGIMSKLPTDQVEALLLHELHHIRRHDFLWNILQRVVETLFFFNPLIWILGREIRQLREELCDQSVIAQTNAPAPYAQALMSLAESSDQTLALAAKSNDGALTRRFRSILSPQLLTSPISKMNSVVELCIIILVSVCCFLPVVGDLNEDLKAESLPAFVEHTAPSGRILDQEGNPVAGARVILHYDKPDLGPGTNTIVEETVSAADGTYQFKSKLKFSRMRTSTWEDAYAVFATHKDWAIGWYYLRAPNIFGDRSNPNPSTLDLYLEKPVTQDFEVKLFGKKDADGNDLDPTPLKGAKVYVYRLSPHKKKPSYLPEDYDLGTFYIHGGDLGLSAGITDENGKVTLTNLPSSKVGFQIVHPDTSISWKTRAYDRKKDWVTKCFPKTSISGVLEDEKGNPIPDTIIHATSPETRPGWYAKTDSKGRYQFPALYGKGHNANRGGGGKAKFSFKLHESDWMMTKRYTCTLNPEEDVIGHKLTATKGVPFHVTVVQKDGEPHAYAPVSIRNEAHSDRKFTDSKGRATFRVLPGDLHCEVYPNADSYWIHENFDASASSSDLYVEPSVFDLSKKFIVDAKLVKTVRGKVSLASGEQDFNGGLKIHPVEFNDHQILTNKGRVSSFKAKVVDSDFEAKLPSEISYVAFALSDDFKRIGSTIIHSDTTRPIIQLTAATEQKLVLYGQDKQPFGNKEIRWGEYHEGEKVQFSTLKTNAAGELTLPGARSSKVYYVEHYNRNKISFKLIEVKHDKVLQVVFDEVKVVPVVDQNNQPIKLSEILQITSRRSGTNYGVNDKYASVDPETGSLKIHENDYNKWVTIPHEKIEGEFKTDAGDVIRCEASSKKPITFRVTSNITHEFARPRMSSLEKAELDKKDTFRAVILNRDGEPIEGAECVLNFWTTDYHLYDEYSSREDFERKAVVRDDHKLVAGQDGMIYIDDTTRNRFYMRIDAEGYASRWITKDSFDRSPLAITLIENTSCRGQLKDEDGKPLAFHPIVFVTTRSYFTGDRYSPIREINPIRVLELTDAEGRFNTLLENGQWQMQAAISDDLVINQKFSLKEGDKLNIQPKFSAASHLALTFQDQFTKAAISGLGVGLNSYNSANSLSSISSSLLKTNETGSLTFKGLIAESYSINLHIGYMYKNTYQNYLSPAESYTSAVFIDEPVDKRKKAGLRDLRLTLKPGSNEKIVHLAKGTMINGKISASIDTDLSNIYIDFSSKGRPLNHSSIRVSKDGSFSGHLPDVGGDEVRVFAYQHKNSPNKTLAPAFSKRFVGEKGENYTFNFHLTPGGSVTGKLLDEEGLPIFGAIVRYEHLAGKNEKGLAWGGTDREGRFTLHGIAAGKIKLLAWKNNKQLIRANDNRSATIKEGETSALGVVQVKEE